MASKVSDSWKDVRTWSKGGCQTESLHEKLVVGLIKDGPRREKTCLRGFANNTGALQPAHPHSLISLICYSLIGK